MMIVLAILFIGLVAMAAAKTWTNHRMDKAMREADEAEALAATESFPYAAYEVEIEE
jgi:hypothetical protein